MCISTSKHGTGWNSATDATCPRHMKGGWAWLAWVGFGEKREIAPARPNGHHRWPRARRACCAGVQHVRYLGGWSTRSRCLSMAVRQTLHRGLARCTACQSFSTLSVSMRHDAVDVALTLWRSASANATYVMVATQWHDSDGSHRALRPTTTTSRCWPNSWPRRSVQPLRSRRRCAATLTRALFTHSPVVVSIVSTTVPDVVFNT